jgi:hypothetical protein
MARATIVGRPGSPGVGIGRALWVAAADLTKNNRAEIVEDSAQAYLHCRLLGREPNVNF